MHSSPLQGKSILLTRAEHQLIGIDQKIRSRGATPVHLPCLAVEHLSNEISQGIALLEEYNDVLFTSTNGVRSLESFCREHGRDLSTLLAHKRVAVVGEKSAAELRRIGIDVDIIPETASQEGLIDAYALHGLPKSLLFFRAQEGRERLAEALQKQGVKVKTITAYRTVCPEGDATEIKTMLQAGVVDAVLLGSTKTARHYMQRIGSSELANRPVVVAISDQMAAATEKLGLNVQVVAKEASFEAMLDALAEYFDANPS